MVSRRSTQSVTQRSTRQSELHMTRRPRRLVAPKTVDDAVGLSRKEERELKKALYASLQESRRARTPLPEEDNEASKEMPKLRKSTRHINPSSSHCARIHGSVHGSVPSASMDESSQDSVVSSVPSSHGSKKKVHAQRKFAQGCSLPSTPNNSPGKKAANASHSLLDRVPKTEDFLTFLCLRGSHLLPPNLDFFNFARDESALEEEINSRQRTPVTSEQGVTNDQTRESTPESSSSGSNVNEELMEFTTPLSTTSRLAAAVNMKAARASAGTPDTARGIVSLRQGLTRKVVHRGSTPPSQHSRKYLYTPDKTPSPSGARLMFGNFTPAKKSASIKCLPASFLRYSPSGKLALQRNGNSPRLTPNRSPVAPSPRGSKGENGRGHGQRQQHKSSGRHTFEKPAQESSKQVAKMPKKVFSGPSDSSGRKLEKIVRKLWEKSLDQSEDTGSKKSQDVSEKSEHFTMELSQLPLEKPENDGMKSSGQVLEELVTVTQSKVSEDINDATESVSRLLSEQVSANCQNELPTEKEASETAENCLPAHRLEESTHCTEKQQEEGSTKHDNPVQKRSDISLQESRNVDREVALAAQEAENQKDFARVTSRQANEALNSETNKPESNPEVQQGSLRWDCNEQSNQCSKQTKQAFSQQANTVLYSNEGEPLEEQLTGCVKPLTEQISIYFDTCSCEQVETVYAALLSCADDLKEQTCCDQQNEQVFNLEEIRLKLFQNAQELAAQVEHSQKSCTSGQKRGNSGQKFDEREIHGQAEGRCTDCRDKSSKCETGKQSTSCKPSPPQFEPGSGREVTGTEVNRDAVHVLAARDEGNSHTFHNVDTAPEPPRNPEKFSPSRNEYDKQVHESRANSDDFLSSGCTLGLTKQVDTVIVASRHEEAPETYSSTLPSASHSPSILEPLSSLRYNCQILSENSYREFFLESSCDVAFEPYSQTLASSSQSPSILEPRSSLRYNCQTLSENSYIESSCDVIVTELRDVAFEPCSQTLTPSSRSPSILEPYSYLYDSNQVESENNSAEFDIPSGDEDSWREDDASNTYKSWSDEGSKSNSKYEDRNECKSGSDSDATIEYDFDATIAYDDRSLPESNTAADSEEDDKPTGKPETDGGTTTEYDGKSLCDSVSDSEEDDKPTGKPETDDGTTTEYDGKSLCDSVFDSEEDDKPTGEPQMEEDASNKTGDDKPTGAPQMEEDASNETGDDKPTGEPQMEEEASNKTGDDKPTGKPQMAEEASNKTGDDKPTGEPQMEEDTSNKTGDDKPTGEPQMEEDASNKTGDDKPTGEPQMAEEASNKTGDDKPTGEPQMEEDISNKTGDDKPTGKPQMEEDTSNKTGDNKPTGEPQMEEDASNKTGDDKPTGEPQMEEDASNKTGDDKPTGEPQKEEDTSNKTGDREEKLSLSPTVSLCYIAKLACDAALCEENALSAKEVVACTACYVPRKSVAPTTQNTSQCFTKPGSDLGCETDGETTVDESLPCYDEPSTSSDSKEEEPHYVPSSVCSSDTPLSLSDGSSNEGGCAASLSEFIMKEDDSDDSGEDDNDTRYSDTKHCLEGSTAVHASKGFVSKSPWKRNLTTGQERKKSTKTTHSKTVAHTSLKQKRSRVHKRTSHIKADMKTPTSSGYSGHSNTTDSGASVLQKAADNTESLEKKMPFQFEFLKFLVTSNSTGGMPDSDCEQHNQGLCILSSSDCEDAEPPLIFNPRMTSAMEEPKETFITREEQGRQWSPRESQFGRSGRPAFHHGHHQTHPPSLLASRHKKSLGPEADLPSDGSRVKLWRPSQHDHVPTLSSHLVYASSRSPHHHTEPPVILACMCGHCRIDADTAVSASQGNRGQTLGLQAEGVTPHTVTGEESLRSNEESPADESDCSLSLEGTQQFSSVNLSAAEFTSLYTQPCVGKTSQDSGSFPQLSSYPRSTLGLTCSRPVATSVIRYFTSGITHRGRADSGRKYDARSIHKPGSHSGSNCKDERAYRSGSDSDSNVEFDCESLCRSATDTSSQEWQIESEEKPPASSSRHGMENENYFTPSDSAARDFTQITSRDSALTSHGRDCSEIRRQITTPSSYSSTYSEGLKGNTPSPSHSKGYVFQALRDNAEPHTSHSGASFDVRSRMQCPISIGKMATSVGRREDVNCRMDSAVHYGGEHGVGGPRSCLYPLPPALCSVSSIFSFKRVPADAFKSVGRTQTRVKKDKKNASSNASPVRKILEGASKKLRKSQSSDMLRRPKKDEKQMRVRSREDRLKKRSREDPRRRQGSKKAEARKPHRAASRPLPSKAKRSSVRLKTLAKILGRKRPNYSLVASGYADMEEYEEEQKKKAAKSALTKAKAEARARASVRNAAAVAVRKRRVKEPEKMRTRSSSVTTKEPEDRHQGDREKDRHLGDRERTEEKRQGDRVEERRAGDRERTGAGPLKRSLSTSSTGKKEQNTLASVVEIKRLKKEGGAGREGEGGGSNGTRQPVARETVRKVLPATPPQPKKVTPKKVTPEKPSSASSSSPDPGLSHLKKVPTFYPTEDEFSDPISYIDSIREKAEWCGMCCIIPPQSWKMESKINEEIRFTTQVQHLHRLYSRWGISVEQTRAIVHHLSDITSNHNSLSTPQIGGVEVDLPQLYRMIRDLGGLQNIVDKKQWVKVADAMKIPKAAHDRVTRLYDVYCKFVLPYAMLSETEREQAQKDVHTHYELSSAEEDAIFKGKSMTLGTFSRISRNVQSMWFREDPTPEMVETTLWKIVEDCKSHVSVQCAHVNTRTQSTAFPMRRESPYYRHSWNLNNLPDNKKCILKCLGPVSGTTIPTLHVGMLFSASCWSTDPHRLPYVQYLHSGANTIWYCIPKSDAEKFHEAMRELCPTLIHNDPLWLSEDTAMVNPDHLKAKGVRVTRCVQQPRQFVVVFPDVYTATVCCGYNVSESVHYATTEWLSSSMDAAKALCVSREKELFSVDTLVCGLCQDSTDIDTLTAALPLLQSIVMREIEERRQLSAAGLKCERRLAVEDSPGMSSSVARKRSHDLAEDSACEVCYKICYLSMVLNEHDEQILCLEHGLRHVQRKRHVKAAKLFYRYTEEELTELVQTTKERLVSLSANGNGLAKKRTLKKQDSRS